MATTAGAVFISSRALEAIQDRVIRCERKFVAKRGELDAVHAILRPLALKDETHFSASALAWLGITSSAPVSIAA